MFETANALAQRDGAPNSDLGLSRLAALRDEVVVYQSESLNGRSDQRMGRTKPRLGVRVRSNDAQPSDPTERFEAGLSLAYLGV